MMVMVTVIVVAISKWYIVMTVMTVVAVVV
jgi:hypothetical protein